MRHLDELIQNNKIANLIDTPCTVTLKLDGTAFQVVYKDGRTEFHKRSGDTKKAGPVIDDVALLHSREYNFGIDFFQKNLAAMDGVSFVACEIISDMVFILAVRDTDGNDIDPEIFSKKLNGAYSVPVLYIGTLSPDQQSDIISFMSGTVKAPDFKKFIYDEFKSYDRFPKDIYDKIDYIEGIVFNFGQSQYKLVNPDFRQRHKDMTRDHTEEAARLADTDKEFYSRLVSWAHDNMILYQTDRWDALNANFLNLYKSPVFKELDSIVSVYPDAPQMLDNRIPDFIKRLPKTRNFYKVYWKFLTCFNKPRKHFYIINKDFQLEINNIINKFFYNKAV